MNINTSMTIIIVWGLGLLTAVAMAKLGYPWLAFLVLLAVSSIRIKWGDDKKMDDGEEDDGEEDDEP